MWRNYLMVSRDVYKCHPFELDDDQIGYCRDFIALRLQEQKEIQAAQEGE